MAVQLVSASSQRLAVSATIVTATPITMSVWFNSTTTAGTQAILGVYTSATQAAHYMDLNGADVRARSNANGTIRSAQTNYNYTANTWNHAAATFDTTTRRVAWLNGSTAVNTQSSAPAATMNTAVLGARLWTNAYGDYFNGQLAHAAIWNVVLTTDELTALSQGYSPLFIRPASLLTYWPLLGNGNELRNARHLTATGAVTWPDARAFFMPSVPLIGKARKKFFYTPTGGMTLGGSASVAVGVRAQGSGGIVISGSALVTSKIAPYTTSGGIKVNGHPISSLHLYYPKTWNWLIGWTYRKKISVKTPPTTDVTNFPLYVRINLDTDIGGKARSDGQDIWFTSSDGTTVLPFEREHYSVSSGQATGHFWVKLPTITASQGGSIYIYYGKPDAPDGQNKAVVWNNGYIAVWHLDENGTGVAGEYKDVANGNNGTRTGTPTQVNGKIYKAQNFVRTSNQGINTATINHNIGTGDFVMEAWVNGNTYTPTRGNSIYQNGTYVPSICVTNSGTTDTTGQYGFFWGGFHNAGATLTSGQWYHVVAQRVTGVIYYYVNGVATATTYANATTVTNAVGRISTDPDGDHWDGVIEEVRFAKVSRSAAWWDFQYRNINQSDNELLWSTEEMFAVRPIVIGGEADMRRKWEFMPTGGITTGGVALVKRGFRYTPTGQILISGTPLLKRGFRYTPIGGIIVSGSAIVRRGYRYTMSGGIVIGGMATVRMRFVYAPFGGIIVSGTAVARPRLRYVPSGGIVVSGVTRPDWATGYAMGGLVRVGFSANVVVIWSSGWDATGSMILGIAATALVAWYAPYRFVSGGFNTGGTSRSFPHLPFISSGCRSNWLAGYSYRKRIDVSTTHLDANLTAFPVYVPLTDADIGSKSLPTGYDVRFTAADGTSALPFEREYYNVSSGVATAAFWVRSNLSTAGTYFYVYYGNSTATDVSQPGSVWDASYRAVYHFPNGSTLSAADSTTNANNGIIFPTCNAVLGKVNGAVSFDGATGYVGMGGGNSLNFAAGVGFTVEAWIKTTDANVPIISFRDGVPNQQGDIDVCIGNNGTSTGQPGHFVPLMRYDSGSGLAQFTSTVAVNDDQWHFVVFVYDPVAQNIRAYVDTAVWTASQTVTGTITTNAVSSANRNLGREGYWVQSGFLTPDTQKFYPGILDEVRISGVARSAAWLKFEYWNINNVGNELSISNQESCAAILVSGTSPAQKSSVYVPLGQIVIGGTALTRRGYRFTSTGGIVLGGAALFKRGYRYVPIGGIVLGGTALFKRGYRFTPTGGIVIGGTALAKKGYRYVATGGIVISGTSGLKKHMVYVATGVIIVSGTSPWSWGTRYGSIGGIVISGQCLWAWYAPYYPYAWIGLAGTTIPDWSTGYGIAGMLVLGIQATTLVNWATSWASTGYVILGIGAQALVRWGTTARVSGGIVIVGTALYTKHIPFQPTGGIIISGTALYRRSFNFLPSGGLIIGGTSPTKRGFVYMGIGGIYVSGTAPNEIHYLYAVNDGIIISGFSLVWVYDPYVSFGVIIVSGVATVQKHLRYVPYGGILFSGNGSVAWGTSYVPVTGIVVSGVTRVDWGTSYIPVVILSLLPNGHPDWATAFGTAGIIILGFQAAVEVIWSSSWQATGTMLLGFSATALVTWGTSYYPIFGIVISGSSGTSVHEPYLTAGGIIISGSSQGLKNLIYDGSGGIVVSGVSLVWLHFPYLPLNGILIGGVSGIAWGTTGNCFAGIVISGTSTVAWGTTYYPYGVWFLSGTTKPDWATAFDTAGIIILGFDANVVIVWASSWTSTGTVLLGFNATAGAQWGTTYYPVSGIVVVGSALASLHLTYVVSGGILIGGGSDIYRGYDYTGTNVIVVSGASLFLIHYPYNPLDGIIVSGSSGLSVHYLYFDSAMILVAGLTDPRWGTSYVPSVNLHLSPDGHPDWATAFGTDGVVILGFDANVQVIWSSGWVAIGTITLGLAVYSLVSWGTSYYPSSGIVVGGVSGTTIHVLYMCAGRIVVNSTVNGHWGTSYVGSSVILVSGSSGGQGGSEYVGDVTIVVSGSAEVHWGTSYVASSSCTLAGTGVCNLGTHYGCVGGIIVSGTSHVDWGTSYLAYSLCVLLGTMIPDWSTGYGVVGTILLGFAADVLVNWATAWETYGTMILGLGSLTQVDWGTTYWVSDGLVIGGSATGLKFMFFDPFGGIVIGGYAGSDKNMFFDPFGGIIISGGVGGTSNFQVHIPFTCAGGIVLGSLTLVSWGTIYVSTGIIIIISGTSRADWGTSYYPYGVLFGVGGGTQPDWSTAFNTAGMLTVGVAADVLINWATNWVTTGVILVGFTASAHADWYASLTASGVIYVSGTSPATVFLSYGCVGGIVVYGTSGTWVYLPYRCVGGIVISGSSHADWYASFLASGTVIVIGGQSYDAWGVSVGPTGQITISGTSLVSWYAPYYPVITLVISGTSKPDWATGYDILGVILLEFDANVLVDWATHWDTSGQLVLGIGSLTQVDWGTSYTGLVSIIVLGSSPVSYAVVWVPGGSIIVSGDNTADWGTATGTSGTIILGSTTWCFMHLPFGVAGGVIISGEAWVWWRVDYLPIICIHIGSLSKANTSYVYFCKGGIRIQGRALYSWYAPYDPLGTIIVGGMSTVDAGATYGVTGHLILGSLTLVDWGTSYVGGVPLTMFGSAPPSWATGYQIDGYVIVGFSAAVEVNWSTSWVTVGLIVLGIGTYAVVAWGTSYVALGTIVIGGSAVLSWYAPYDPFGVIYIDPVAFIGSVITWDAVGGIVLSDSATVDWGTSYEPVSGIFILGTSQSDYGTTYEFDGLIVIVGDNTADWGTSYIPPSHGTLFLRGLIFVYGSAVITVDLSYVPVGGIVLSGTDQADWGVSYDPLAAIFILGTSHPSWATGYGVNGAVIIGFAADTPIDWSTYYTINGQIVIGFVAGSIVDWGTSDVMSGGIVINSTSHCDWYAPYVTTYGIRIEGDAIILQVIGWDGQVTIVISDSAEVTWHAPYEPELGIIVSGSSEYTVYLPYDAFVGIVVDSMSLCAWYVGYDSVGGFQFLPDGTIAWINAYVTFGSIIIGFAAESTVDWAAWYDPQAGIVFFLSSICELWLTYLPSGFVIIISGQAVVLGRGQFFYDPVLGILIGGHWDYVHIPIYQTYNGYTVIDTDDKLTLTGSTITVTELDRQNFGDFYHRVYKIFGPAYFGNTFTHTFEFSVAPQSDPKSYVAFWALSNTEDCLAEQIEMHYQSVGVFFFNDRLCIHNFESGTRVSSAPLQTNTMYYVTVVRNGTAISASIFTDLARTQLFGTITTTLPVNRTYRYFYALNNADETDPDCCPFYGVVQNHNLGEFYVIQTAVHSDGAIYTWGTSYVGEGVIEVIPVSEVVLPQRSFDYVATGGIVVSGQGTIDLILGHEPDVVLVVSGDSIVVFGATYFVVGAVIVGVVSDGQYTLILTGDGSFGLVISGASACALVLVYVPGLVLGLGSLVSADWGANYLGSANLVVDGELWAFVSLGYLPSVDVVLSGSAEIGFTYQEVSGFSVIGSSIVDWGVSYVMVGQVVLSGDTWAALFQSYVPLVGLILEGSVPLDWATHYASISGVIIGFSAICTITFASYWTYVAGAIIGLTPVSIVTWAVSIDALGGLVLAGDASVTWYVSVVADGLINLVPSAGFSSAFLYWGAASIDVQGASVCSGISPWVGVGGIVLSGQFVAGVIAYYEFGVGGLIVSSITYSTLHLTFTASGEVVLSGAAFAEILSGYYPTGEMIVGGTSDFWVLHYIYVDGIQVTVYGMSDVIMAHWVYETSSGVSLVDKGYDITMSYWSTSGLGLMGTAAASICGLNLVYTPTQQQNFTTDFTAIDSSGTLETQGTTASLTGFDTSVQEVKLYQLVARSWEEFQFVFTFLHRFRVTVDPMTGNNAEIAWWALSREISSLSDWENNNSQALAVGWFSNNIWVRDYATGNSQQFSTPPGSFGIQVERDFGNFIVYIMDDSFTTILAKLELLISPEINYVFLWAYNSTNAVSTSLLKLDSVSALDTEHYYYGVTSELEIYQALYFQLGRALVSVWYAVQGDILLEITPEFDAQWKIGYETKVLIDVQPWYLAVVQAWTYVPDSGIKVSGTSDLYVTWNYVVIGYRIKVTPNALAWTGVRYYYDPVFGISLLIGGTSAITRVYGAIGGIIIGGESDAAITSFSTAYNFPWHMNRAITNTQDFPWSSGQEIQYWYRVETYCTQPSCDVGIDPDVCPYGVGKAQSILYIAASSTKDLCTKMSAMLTTTPALKWPIKQIQRISQPLRTTDYKEGDDYCTELITENIDVTQECLEFTLYAGINVPNVHIGAFAFLTADFGYKAIGWMRLEGEAEALITSYHDIPNTGLEVSGEAIIAGWYFVDGNAIVNVGGSYDDTEHFEFLSDILIIVDGEIEIITHFESDKLTWGGGFTELEVEELTWREEGTLSPINILPTAQITTQCINSSMPYVLIMTQNFSENNIFADFLSRNNYTMGNLRLRYEGSQSWKQHLHFTGRGIFGEVEKWVFTFEWTCSNQIADIQLYQSVWVFAATIMRELAPLPSLGYITTSSKKKLEVTRILVAFDTTGTTANEVLDLTFALNTQTGILVNSYPYLNVVYNIISDNVGMFRNPAWSTSPLLNIGISQLTPERPNEQYSLDPYIPTVPAVPV